MRSIPFQTLAEYVKERLDECPSQDANVLSVQSTGRCGSTLLSKVLDKVGGVHSLSEPDVYTQVWSSIIQGEAVTKTADMQQILHDVTMLNALALRDNKNTDVSNPSTGLLQVMKL